MSEDFLLEMGYSGLTGRLKRLSDAFMYQTRDLYREYDEDIEPNWHMIFLLLQKNETMTVTALAEALQLSHPAIVKLINKMKKKGYIDSVVDAEDKRKYDLMLSQKAKQKLPKFQKYWEAGEKALQELLNHNKQLLEQLEQLEAKMAETDFRTRMDKLLVNE
ncbi:MarR family winged helix-turn-helix transcriptional regulator [Leeuwenhoekiella marinoflava]|uniref:DNA-binding MarR family transcriptional regulator n=2 Tax=Leeuwenhoekiella marinoflava TaxID=988 RepID=A0A4Q0PK56_9FLAO|nr:helix-turn-helix domain-containing protein [Leeuwenhoekiella marinoflava]RXG27636.1 DNA-binding MarR family transcriptional regulator [Leeuwenhoekiella marinoflava]SHF67660.1 DNA-binding transcriptional regulator, MarR family [Leeuwenhoekiella marinoflava DSM 3653]